MKRISSFWTALLKRVFPLVFFAVLAIVAAQAVAEGKLSTDPAFFLGSALAAGFVYLLWRVLVSDLADEVLDFGDHLLVRRGALKERVYLSNIVKVDTSFNTNPERMTLHLVEAGRLGRLITFSPAPGKSLNPLARNPLAEELMSRAQKARSKSEA
jgi:hypothetical protein